MQQLQVENLYLHYDTLRGSVRAVDNVSFALEKGKTLGLVGESGCGKSSTAIALMRLLPRNVKVFKGKVLLGDMDLMKLSDEEFRRQIRWKRISMVFQGAMNSLNPVLKTGFQVAEPLLITQKMGKKEAINYVKEFFKTVGLPPEFADRYPHELSGGMRQRVVIAMALVLNPEIVILDEPTSALDVSIQAQIMNLLKKLKKERGISMIFITHDIALASDLCDVIGVMYGGQIIELGVSEKILLAPKHPYTRKLISSVPSLRKDNVPEFIPGAPPDLVNPPKGCRFHPRCPFKMDKCEIIEPSLISLDEKQKVKCHLYSDQ